MPGTVLLLAASPVGKGCLVDAASVLPVLAAVSPSVLSGTDTANVVELADPLEPQAVLTRLRAAATAPGPLTVFLTGQLQLDRRQRLPHLALARTTPATVRYTAFPWHWITEELRLRAPGTTTVFADLHADAETWEHLASRPLSLGRAVSLYGRVAPPPPRRRVATPTYMKSLATILRSGHRPAPPALHHESLTRSIPEDARAVRPDMVLAPGGSGWGWGVQAVPAAAPPMAGPAGPAGAATPLAPRAAALATPPLPLAEEVLASATSAATRTPPPPPPPFAPADQPAVPPGSPGTHPDLHAVITSAVQAARHGEAAALAAQGEQEALRMYGPASEQAFHWMEVRADLAMFAGDAVRSCEVWLAVARARLGAGQAPDASAVEAAVDRAHHQWGSIRDAARARELGSALAELRQRVPGRREGALQHVRRHLDELHQTELTR